MKRTRLPLLAASALLASVSLSSLGCGNGNGNLPPPPPPPPPPPVAAVAPTASASAEPVASAAPEATPPKLPDVSLSLGTAAPDPKPAPTVRFAAPYKGQLVDPAKAADFEVKLDVTNWKTAHCDAHVHVILDNKPYKAIYDAKAPIKLRDLPGGDALAEGQHVLVAFPSRATHESVKTPGALAITEFYVGKKKGTPTVDITKPLLVFSRPKGDYKGDMANHVLVDFQLVNAKLDEKGQHVHVSVSGPGIEGAKTADAVKFGAPFFLDALSDGAYTVKLELDGADGQPIANGAWNTTERTIKVDRAGTPDCAPGAPMPANH